MADAQKYPAPLTKSGALDKQFQFEETTPTIGREYPKVNIVDEILNAANAEDLIRDLAVTSKSSRQHVRRYILKHRSFRAWCGLLPSSR